MSKVLLVNSYFYRLDSKQWKFKQPYPPLATLQAAAVVRAAGHATAFVDVSLFHKPSEIQPSLIREGSEYFIIYDDGFNYLTKMCLTVMREAACQMASMAKEHGYIVIISSSDSTDHYDKYFPHGVDYVVRGEGEETLLELLRCLDSKGDVSTIAGLAYQKEGKSITTQQRPVHRHLDAFPLPAWDLIDLEPYQSIWRKHHDCFSLNLATTRGCPYKCNWCAKQIGRAHV